MFLYTEYLRTLKMVFGCLRGRGRLRWGGMGAEKVSQILLSVLDFELRDSIFFFCSTGVWTQSLTLARQMLYHLSTHMSPTLFALGYFSDRVSGFCPELAFDWDSPTCTSQVAGIIDVHHHVWLFFFFGSTGIWTEGLMLSRQVLYHLSHSARSVLCWVFSRQGLTNYLPGLTSNGSSPDLCLLSS
jgi:hypothetical protein